MNVSGVYSNRYGTNTNEAKEYKNTLDKDAFLNLLVTQLRYQNPLQPMEDKEFISQMAQFSSLEQAQNTNRITKMNSAYNMVNRLISATIKDEKDKSIDIVGIVDKVKVDGNNIYLVVNDKEIPYEDIKEVTELISPLEQTEVISQSLKFNIGYSMLGKLIKAKQGDVEIDGIVESIRSKEGSIQLKVGDKYITLDEIYEVR